jgi:calmodulin
MALRALGLLANNQEVASLAMKLDPDRTGLLDLEDFLKCVVEMKSKPDTPEDIRAAFSVFDKEGTGLLRVDEFLHVL